MNETKADVPSETMAEKDQAFSHETTQKLIEKGFTPHTSEGPFGRTSRWEDNRVEVNLWPVVTIIVFAMIFILLMVKGVPWQ